MLDLKNTSEGIVFKIHVQPRASKNEAAGIHGDSLKIRLTAPPADNAANRMCIKFLSKQLGIPKSRLEIVSGHASRSKQILARHPHGTPPDSSAALIRKKIKALAGE